MLKVKVKFFYRVNYMGKLQDVNLRKTFQEQLGMNLGDVIMQKIDVMISGKIVFDAVECNLERKIRKLPKILANKLKLGKREEGFV